MLPNPRYPRNPRFLSDSTRQRFNDFENFLQRPAKFSEGRGERLELTSMTEAQGRPKQERRVLLIAPHLSPNSPHFEAERPTAETPSAHEKETE
jgi:hypothetical protein